MSDRSVSEEGQIERQIDQLALDEDDSEFEGGSEQDQLDYEDGFLVRDEEVAEEYQQRKHKKHKRHKDGKRKKKRMQLDPDDMDIIQNDTLMKPRAPKTRKLPIVGEDLDEEEEIIEEPEELNQVDILPQEEDDEGYGGVTKEQLMTALSIFGEDEAWQKPQERPKLREIVEEDKSQFTSSKRKTQTRKAVSFHDQVASSQYPERYLRKIRNYVGAENVQVELEHETKWMALRLKEQLTPVRSQTIKSILNLIRVKKIDLPFIKQYVILQMDDCTPELIDIISEIHQSWFGYLSSLQALNFRISKLRAFQERIFKDKNELFPPFTGILERMKTLPPQEVIDDYREYLMFYLQMYQCDRAMNAPPDKDPEQIRASLTSHNQLQEAVNAGAPQFARDYLLSPEDMAENIEKCCQIKSPGVGVGDPRYLFEKFQAKLSNADNEMKVLSRLVDLIAEELSRQPQILKFFKDQYMRKSYISSSPKEKSKEVMDIFHPLFPAKRIQRRPLGSFLNGGDMLWQYLLKAEKEGLIQIEIELSPSSTQELLSDMTKYYQDNTQLTRNPEMSEIEFKEKEHNLKSWNIVRSQVIKAFMKKVDELVKVALRRKLTSYSEKALVDKCSDSLEAMLLKMPKKMIETIGEDRVELTPKLMVLLINQDEAKQIHKQCAGVYGVVIGRNGELINDFYLSSFLERRRLPKRDGTALPNERNEARNEEAHKLLKQKIQDLAPEVIVIGANCLEARFLEDKLQREIFPEIERGIREEGEAGGNFSDHEEADQRMMKVKKQPRSSEQVFEMPETFKAPEILMETTHLGQIYSRSSLSQKEVPNLSNPKRVALSMGRAVQDPLCEILHNWKEDSRENKILQLNLHPMQNNLDKEVLQDGLEKRAIKVTNQVGVELTTIRDFPHLSHTVPFISGFGPITAAQFLEKLRSSSTHLCMRMQIYAQTLLPESIFLNCAPFVRVRKPYEEQKASKRKNKKKKAADYSETDLLYHPFDQTRIDVQRQYQIAEKLCRCVLSQSTHSGVSDVLEQGGAPLVEFVMANPYYLTNANLQNLRVALFQDEKDESTSFTEPQQLRMIEFLIRELTNPFEDPRMLEHNLPYNPQEKQQKDVLLNMIKESPETFYTGMIVTGTIFYVGQAVIRVRLENGLECIIHVGDCDLPGIGMNQGNGNIEKYQLITGRIKEIQYDQYTAKLNAKLEELSSHRGYIRAIWPELDNSFMLQEDDVENNTYDPIKQIEKEKEEKIRVNKRYTPRGIAHPHFKNMTYMKAVAYLTKNDKETPPEKQLNNFVFRPSSYGPDHLTLTWRFFRRNIVHLDIEEHRKKPDSLIGELLVMNGEEYDTLDEIITRFIYPCTQIVQDTLKHRKFVMQCTSADQLKLYIKEEQSKTPTTVQYNFGIFPQFPQHVVLMYSMNQSGRVYVEYIKVKPRGYWFHDQYFQNLERLVYFFKNNQSKLEYQKHAKKMKPPAVVFREQAEIPQAEEEWKGAEKDWIVTDAKQEGSENIKNELPKREKTPRQQFDPSSWGQGPLSETQNVQNEWGTPVKADLYESDLKREHRSTNYAQPDAASSWGAGTSAAPASEAQSWGTSLNEPQQVGSAWGQTPVADTQQRQEAPQGWGSSAATPNQPASGNAWGSTPTNTIGQTGSGGGWGSNTGGDWGSSGGGNSSWGNDRDSGSGFNDRKRDDRFGDSRNRDGFRGRNYGDRGDRGDRGGRGRDSGGYGRGNRGRGDRDDFRGQRGGRGGRGGYRNDDSNQGRSSWGNQRDEGGSSGGWGGSSFQSGGRNQSGGGWSRGDRSQDQQERRKDEETGWGSSNKGSGQGWGGGSSNQRQSNASSSWGNSKPQQGGWGGSQDQQLGKRTWTSSGAEGEGDGGYGGDRKQKRFEDDRGGDSWGGGRNRGRSEGRGGFGGRDDRRGGRGGRGGDFRGGRGGDFRGGRGGDFRGGRGGGRGRDRNQGFGGGRSGGWSNEDRGQNRDSWGGNQQSGGQGSGWGQNRSQREEAASSGWGGNKGSSESSGGWGSGGNNNQSSGGGWGGGDNTQQQSSGWGEKAQQSSGGGWGETQLSSGGGWGEKKQHKQSESGWGSNDRGGSGWQ